jgi:cytochrome c oxidase cbb3-type subunit 3
VRSEPADTHASQMPRYGLEKLLDDGQINDAAEYVLSLSSKSADATAAGRGQKLFAEQCSTCHGENGKGNKEFGAPNLTDAIWLYGGSREAIIESIRTGRGGVMPAWTGRLDPVTVKSLAIYVHSLGGGR